MRQSLIRLVTTSILLTHACLSAAGVSPITVTFNGGSTSFSTGSSGSAYYIVAVNPAVPSGAAFSLTLKTPGNSADLTATQLTSITSPCTGVATLCGNTFSLAAGQSCCLAFTLTSSTAGNYTLAPAIQTTPVATYGAYAYPAQAIAVAGAPATVTLTPTVTTLGLAISGRPRQITLTNNTSTVAYNVNYTVSPALPSGSISPLETVGCGDIPASGGTCVFVITPGATASPTTLTSNPPSTTPSVITVTGDNVTALPLSVYILTYGSVYQSGFIFDINDNQGCPLTPCPGSIGGTNLALTDQPSSSTQYLWDSSTACAGGNCTDTNADSFTAGSTNTTTIIAALTPPENESTYAAGVCALHNPDGLGPFYLPASCQLDSPNDSGSNCNPGTANVVDNLSFLIPNTSCECPDVYSLSCLSN